MMRIRKLITLALAIGLLPLGACKTTSTGEKPVNLRPGESPLLSKAETFYQQEKYTDAMIECIDQARRNPELPGLTDLQNRIVKKLTEQRAAAAAVRNPLSQRAMSTEVDTKKSLPDTYGVRRTVRGESGSHRVASTSMQQALQKKVTLHLEGVNLDAFILAVGAAEGINIIADKLDNQKTMTVHAENVPLQEILDYVSRNLGVAFYIGENLIWATPKESSEPATPIQTRLYRLHKGISNQELQSEGKINIIEAIERFVPKSEGSDLLFDHKAHVLIVRNTRENLAKVEELVDALDVCPPQILIEARFVSTGINDLRELGIDWILNSPIAVTKRTTLNNGSPSTATETRIAPPAGIGFPAFQNSAQGMNFSYEGLLTEPMFKAVIHALDTSGKSRTLSVPKVTTVNNREAMLRIGEDFRYFEEYSVQSVPSGQNETGAQTYTPMLVPVGTPVKEELGITLNVTPSVGADLRSIMLHILPEISEFVRYEYYEVGSSTANGTTGTTNGMSSVKLPIFRRSKLETELIVQSGETVVMGGLISSSEGKTEQKVPILSSIPLIGRLFRHDTIEEQKRNLIIFVTATIQSELGENLVPLVEDTPATPAAN